MWRCMHDQDKHTESHNKEKVAAIFEKLDHCTEPADNSDGEGEICRPLLFLVKWFQQLQACPSPPWTFVGHLANHESPRPSKVHST